MTREELAATLERLAGLIRDPLETRTWPSDLAALALDNLDMIVDALNDVQVMDDDLDELRAGADHLASKGFHGIAERIRIAADKLGRLRWEALRAPSPEPTAEEERKRIAAWLKQRASKYDYGLRSAATIEDARWHEGARDEVDAAAYAIESNRIALCPCPRIYEQGLCCGDPNACDKLEPDGRAARSRP